MWFLGEEEECFEKGENWSLDEWRSCWLDRVQIGFGVEPKYSFGCMGFLRGKIQGKGGGIQRMFSEYIIMVRSSLKSEVKYEKKEE